MFLAALCEAHHHVQLAVRQIRLCSRRDVHRRQCAGRRTKFLPGQRRLEGGARLEAGQHRGVEFAVRAVLRTHRVRTCGHIRNGNAEVRGGRHCKQQQQRGIAATVMQIEGMSNTNIILK